MLRETNERKLRKAEIETNRLQNVILHQDEILSRPKRTWFQTENERKLAKLSGTGQVYFFNPLFFSFYLQKLSISNKNMLKKKNKRMLSEMVKKDELLTTTTEKSAKIHKSHGNNDYVKVPIFLALYF